MIDLSIIIVNFNTCEILRDCLANLSQISPKEAEIIVVDNNSSDGAPDMVEKDFPKIILIRSKENLGIAKAANLALEKAQGSYVLFLGSDAFPKGGSLEGMVDYMDKNLKVGIATCRILLRDGSLDKDSHRGFPTPWAALTHFSKLDKIFAKSKLFGSYYQSYKDLSRAHEIDACISHYMFARKDIFKDIGGWDEDFFVYGEDIDLCYRVKSAGWQIMYLPQFEVIHYKGASVGLRKETQDITKASEETKNKMRASSIEAMKLFYAKHYQSKYPKILTTVILKAIEVLGYFRMRGGA